MMIYNMVMVRNWRKLILGVIVALCVGGIAYVGSEPQTDVSTTKHKPQTLVADTEKRASVVLESLAIKGRAPKTDYAREQFGAGWALVDACDMRNYILARDMTAVRFDDDDDCTVLSGELHDPYTGNTIHFQRGQDTSRMVQIDHIVALSNAWQTGAQQLDEGMRAELANDPLNLLAVDGPTNNQKSDGDAATWLPPNKTYRCQYVARQIAVKQKYTLWVTPAEHDAMQRVLQTCDGQQLPAVVVRE